MFSEAVFGRKPLQFAIGFAACNRAGHDSGVAPTIQRAPESFHEAGRYSTAHRLDRKRR
jgi:hypothetical protein